LWTEGTKYYSQANHLMSPHQSFYLYTNTRIGHLRNNSRTFTKRLNFLWLLNLVFFIVFLFLILIFIIPVVLTLPSLLSYPYSYPLHFLSFCATIHCSPSQLLFLPLPIHSFPYLHFSLLPAPNLLPPSYSPPAD
jgi:hypothetical protein